MHVISSSFKHPPRSTSIVWALSLAFYSVVFSVTMLPFLFVAREPTIYNLFHIKRRKGIRDKLVVFNAIGRKSNLILVEHARREIFHKEEWDCISFMYVKEDRIEADSKYLQLLDNDLGCSIIRMPGLHWGDFLHFISPTLTSNYDYVSIVLDDVFIPHQGEHEVNVSEMIVKMKDNSIDVFSPCIINDTFGSMGKAQRRGLEGCVVEVDFIEVYIKLFTRKAWECFFKMLHYTGRKGWYYDVLFKDFCPNFTLAQDFSRWAWHMDKTLKHLPLSEVNARNLASWDFESQVNDKGSISGDLDFCKKIGCSIDDIIVRYEAGLKREIWCPKHIP